MATVTVKIIAMVLGKNFKTSAKLIKIITENMLYNLKRNNNTKVLIVYSVIYSFRIITINYYRKITRIKLQNFCPRRGSNHGPPTPA